MFKKYLSIAMLLTLITASTVFAQTGTTPADKKAKKAVIKEKIKHLDPAAKKEIKADAKELKQEVKDGKITKKEAKTELKAKIKEAKAAKKK